MELSSRIFLAAVLILLLPAAIEVGPLMVAEAQEELLCEECQDWCQWHGFPFLDCAEGNCQCGWEPLD
ncbi:hypothetical protein BRADI_3g16585v3 [Brachypodium distachyon]|uniref:Embryo surrounding factor 1 brassicaceae domain-containing protein n=1 Tax=Brachypodium distachyon TaxID=15368 RepID=A0A0Q3F7D6_BRADI|nr:hypothetical protein BRADI_3g16585v3 [Brachypodium distachyon]